MNAKVANEFRQLFVEPTSKKACTFVARSWLKSARSHINQKGSFSTALTGGSTPFEIYQQIVQLAPEYSLDWNKISLFWTDERCVPLDHPDSNYQMARNSGILDLPIPKSQIHPMRFGLEGSPEHDGMRYDKLLKQKLGVRALDFILMGMGEDGHTASLFTGSSGFEKLAKTSKDQRGETAPFALSHFIETKGVWRMTLTLSFINRSDILVGCALGEKKSEILASVFKDDKMPYRYPASWLGCEKSPITWVADSAAAKLIQPS